MPLCGHSREPPEEISNVGRLIPMSVFPGLPETEMEVRDRVNYDILARLSTRPFRARPRRIRRFIAPSQPSGSFNRERAPAPCSERR